MIARGVRVRQCELTRAAETLNVPSSFQPGFCMPTRSARLADFVTDGAPAPDTLVELLCEDHVGTYLLPYLCTSDAEGFRNASTGERIQGCVVGWREPIVRPAVSAGVRETL